MNHLIRHLYNFYLKTFEHNLPKNLLINHINKFTQNTRKYFVYL